MKAYCGFTGLDVEFMESVCYATCTGSSYCKSLCKVPGFILVDGHTIFCIKMFGHFNGWRQNSFWPATTVCPGIQSRHDPALNIDICAAAGICPYIFRIALIVC